MGQQQVQQPGTSREQKQKRKGFSRKQRLIATIVAALIVALAIATAQVLSGAKIIPDIWATISNAIVGTFGMLFAFFALIPLLFAFDDPQPVSAAATQVPAPLPPVASPQPIIIQLQQPPAPQPLPPPIPQPPVPEKPVTSNITGSFPPTDPKTIQQRRKLVEEVYAELTKPDINCIVLTGIGGIGKSTAAALVYKYAEEQRKDDKGPFAAEALWITVEETTATFAYLAETISAVLGKPIPDFGKLPPQNQAAALFNALNIIDHPCLIVVNQFENLLDSQTGQATDPGLGEWLDILNSRLCRCRVLLTSRPMPRGTQDYPPTHVQEYPVAGLATSEGMDLLRKQGVQTAQATDAELRIAVARCAGHALSLELLASILRRNQSLSLHSLFNNPLYAQLWTGDIARKLLDYIYEQQLDDVQRQLLRAFSVYREPVPLEAAQTLLEATALQTRILDALNVLIAQQLLQDVGNECYQLHAIVTAYVRGCFDERDEQANKQVLRAAHTKAAQYYMRQAEANCPPREKRRKVEDVKPLIEAAWQYCQAAQRQEAYNLVRKEGIYDDLKRWGGNATLFELYQLLLPSDEWQPESSQTAQIYNDLGWVYSDIGQKKQAQGYYEQALSIYKEIGDRRGEGTSLNNLGLIYNILGKKEEAREYYERALAIHRELGDQEGEVRSLNNLGRVYSDLGRVNSELRCFEQAVSILRKTSIPAWEGRTFHNLGMVYRAMLRNEDALACFEQALSIHRKLGDLGEEGKVLNSLGMFYIALGKHEDALKYYEQALDIHSKIGNRLWEGIILNNLGAAYNALRMKDTALKCLLQALDIEKEVGNRGDEGITLHNIGTLYFERNHYDVALAFFLSARGIYEEVQSPHHESVQRWIDDLREEIGEEKFITLLAQVEPRASQIVERALHEGL